MALDCSRFLFQYREPGIHRVLEDFRRLIDERVQARALRGNWVGLALGMQLKGTVQIHTYGYADLENLVPVREDSVFRIGSLTKQFTAALVLKLAELGKLSIDDDITSFLPDYPARNRRITLHHLLSHTSGIQTYSTIPEFWKRSREDLSPEAIADLFKDEPLRFEPGERYEYNNSGYHLLGMIIEKVLSKPYSECLADQLFSPLDLRRICYLETDPVVPSRVRGYVHESGETRNAPYLSMSLPYAAGALGSTVGDLLGWQRALNEHKILSERSLRLMRTPVQLRSGTPMTYGYGVAIANFDGEVKVTHSGGIHGFVSVLSHYPREDLTIAVLVNTGSANPWAVDSEIARIILNRPIPPVQRVSLSPEELQLYCGTYLMGDRELEVALEEDELVCFGQSYLPVGNHTFINADDPESKIIFSVSSDGVDGARMSREGIDTPMQRASGTCSTDG